MRSRAAASDTLAGKLMLVSAIAFSIAFATITLAHVFERFGYAPCPLCLQERYAYYFAVPALVAAFFAARAESFTLTRILLALTALSFLINAVVGIYHSLKNPGPGRGFSSALRSENGSVFPGIFVQPLRVPGFFAFIEARGVRDVH